MKDKSQSLVTNLNSALLTSNQIRKTRNLQGHRSFYLSISDINSILNTHGVRQTACQQSSPD
jgi:hypothetical protein